MAETTAEYSKALQKCDEERLVCPPRWTIWMEDGKVTAGGIKATDKRKADKEKESMKTKLSES